MQQQDPKRSPSPPKEKLRRDSSDMSTQQDTSDMSLHQDSDETPQKPENQNDELSDQREAESTGPRVYLTGMKLWGVMFALTLQLFLVLLDTSILATAAPVITNDFHSLEDIGWYVASYQLANATLQPLFGKIYQYFRTKWVYLFAVLMFSLGSLICATANSSKVLIAGRTIAGIGGSGLFNGSLLILASIAPLEKRAKLNGVLLGFSQLGLIAGPLIGGVFTEYVTWRWCFYINLPLTAIVIPAVIIFPMPDQIPKAPAMTVIRDKKLWYKLDLVGLAIFAPATIMLLLGLQWGGNQLAWNSATVIGLICGAVGTAIVFLFWERHVGEDAMIPLSIVRNRIVAASSLVGTFTFTGIFLPSYFLPVYFQSVRAATPFQSGVYLLPSILGQLIFSVLTGILISKTGYYLPFSVLSAAIISIGSGLFSTLSPTSSSGEWIGYQVFHGAGRGLGIQNPIIAIQSALPPDQLAVSMAFLVFCQTIGSSVFITIANTIFDNSLRSELISRGLPLPTVGAVIEAGATAFRKVVGDGELQAAILSYTKSFDRVFYLGIACAILAFFFAWAMGFKRIQKEKDAPVVAAAVAAAVEPEP